MVRLPELFDANKVVGYTFTARPDFPEVKDLLAHMDRLGIARALVWNAAARGFNCRWANERLLQEICETPEAAGRVVPAFAVAPTMIYEHGAIERTKSSMEEHGVRALRFPLPRQSWSLSTIEPVIEVLLRLQPVLFLDFRDPFQKQDVLSFAERFPTSSIVSAYLRSFSCSIASSVSRSSFPGPTASSGSMKTVAPESERSWTMPPNRLWDEARIGTQYLPER